MTVTRRGFLQSGSVLAAGGWVAATAGLTSCAEPRDFKSGQKPRKIIHLIADGTSIGTLTCADLFAQMTLGRRLHWCQLQGQPQVANGWMNMRSLTSIVTDSAAASSSWGSGARVQNGCINLLPDETPLKTLYELLGEVGWKRGLVTTSTVTHATPAGMLAHQKDRNEEWAVARDYFGVKPELVLGGGRRFFAPQLDNPEEAQSEDWAAEFQKAGYRLVETRTQLIDSPTGKPLLGLFEPSHMTYQIDRAVDEELKRQTPTLAEMTHEALRHWENVDRFFLQIEGARVDHAAHASDAGAILAEMLDFDAAVGLVREFQQRHPDTLLVLCTDHGNSNLGVNGMGKGYADSLESFQRVRGFNASHGRMLRMMGEAPTSEQVGQVIFETTGIRVVTAELDRFASMLGALAQLQVNPWAQFNRQLSPPANALGAILANYTGMGWCGNTHTSDYVPITATGPGQERFQGWVENVDLFRHFTELAGIDFRNPQQPQKSLAQAGAEERVGDYG